MKKFLGIALLSLSGGIGCGFANTLIFATEANYSPFVYLDASNQMHGFDVEIAEALCTKMQVDCQFVNSQWSELFPKLRAGQVDVLFGGIGITAPRQKIADFTIPYYQNTVTFIVNKQHPLTLTENGLQGKTIGVERATTFENYIEHVYHGIVNLKLYNTSSQALAALKNSEVEAVLIDTPVALDWLNSPDNKDYITDGQITSTKYFGPGNAMAVKKGNVKLLDALNQAIVEIQKDGTYTTIKQKYFGN